MSSWFLHLITWALWHVPLLSLLIVIEWDYHSGERKWCLMKMKSNASGNLPVFPLIGFRTDRLLLRNVKLYVQNIMLLHSAFAQLWNQISQPHACHHVLSHSEIHRLNCIWKQWSLWIALGLVLAYISLLQPHVGNFTHSQAVCPQWKREWEKLIVAASLNFYGSWKVLKDKANFFFVTSTNQRKKNVEVILRSIRISPAAESHCAHLFSGY